MRISLENKKINIKQATAVILSFINLYILFLSISIFKEYLEVLKKGNLGHFQFHIVWSDITLMTLGVIVLVDSIFAIIGYFKQKKIRLIEPVLLFLFSFLLFFIIPYSLSLLQKIN